MSGGSQTGSHWSCGLGVRRLGEDVVHDLGALSDHRLEQICEQLAERVAAVLRDRFGSVRWVECEVLEDGILGGGVRWPVYRPARG
jgi:hypothetical protein